MSLMPLFKHIFSRHNGKKVMCLWTIFSRTLVLSWSCAVNTTLKSKFDLSHAFQGQAYMMVLIIVHWNQSSISLTRFRDRPTWWFWSLLIEIKVLSLSRVSGTGLLGGSNHCSLKSKFYLSHAFQGQAYMVVLIIVHWNQSSISLTRFRDRPTWWF